MSTGIFFQLMHSEITVRFPSLAAWKSWSTSSLWNKCQIKSTIRTSTTTVASYLWSHNLWISYKLELTTGYIISWPAKVKGVTIAGGTVASSHCMRYIRHYQDYQQPFNLALTIRRYNGYLRLAIWPATVRVVAGEASLSQMAKSKTSFTNLPNRSHSFSMCCVTTTVTIILRF